MFPVPYHPDFPVGYITLPFTPTPPSQPLVLVCTLDFAKVLNTSSDSSLILRATTDSDVP